MHIAPIGRLRGFFSIFVPGMFLLSNLIGAVYLLPLGAQDAKIKEFINGLVDKPVFIVLVGVTLGILVGVILRLLSAGWLDRWSAVWIRAFNRRALKAPPEGVWMSIRFYWPLNCIRRAYGSGDFKLWSVENFPYFDWMKSVSGRNGPPGAKRFCCQVWCTHKHEGRENTSFFNFFKAMVNSVDERSGAEVFGLEDIVRYIVGMFYALFIAFLLVVGTFVWCWWHSREPMVILLVVAVFYLIAMGVILSRFRFWRIKETESLLAACFINRDIFFDPDWKRPR